MQAIRHVYGGGDAKSYTTRKHTPGRLGRDAKPMYDASDESVIVPAARLEKLEIPDKPNY